MLDILIFACLDLDILILSQIFIDNLWTLLFDILNKSEYLSRELMLVADALRLGGAILGNHSDMLAPQLIGRLLPEIGANVNVRMLLRACDHDGVKNCALLPLYHCLHTPGGPLKVIYTFIYIANYLILLIRKLDAAFFKILNCKNYIQHIKKSFVFVEL